MWVAREGCHFILPTFIVIILAHAYYNYIIIIIIIGKYSSVQPEPAMCRCLRPAKLLVQYIAKCNIVLGERIGDSDPL